jgi:hypothetical protein
LQNRLRTRSAVLDHRMDQSDTVSELRREVAGLRFGLFLTATVILGALALWNLFVAFNIPKYEKIFEDMLGSRDKLPVITKWVVDYARLGGGQLMPIAVVGAFSLGAWSVMLLTRHSWKFMLVAILAVIGLTLHGLVITAAMQFPLMQIIQGINEHS